MELYLFNIWPWHGKFILRSTLKLALDLIRDFKDDNFNDFGFLSKILKNLSIRKQNAGDILTSLPFCSTVHSDHCTKLIPILWMCARIS